MKFKFLFVTTALVMFHTAGALSGPIDILRNRYDNNATASNVSELVLDLENVNVSKFGKLWSYDVDGAIFAQPLYVANLILDEAGTTRNVLFVVTMNNVAYAFDADEPGRWLWRDDFRSKEIKSATPPFESDMSLGSIGIAGTPVIDRKLNAIFFVTETQEKGRYIHCLYKVDIRFGTNLKVVQIESSFPETVNFSKQHTQRAGLAISSGQVWVAFGGAIPGDHPPWHGVVMTYDEITLSKTGEFDTTIRHDGGSIWQSGGAPAVDKAGFVYYVTGNADSSLDTPGNGEYADTLLKLSWHKGISLEDWYQAANEKELSQRDLDLGVSGPLLVPNTSLIAIHSKTGLTRILDTEHLGYFDLSDRSVKQIVQTGPDKSEQNSGDRIIGAAYWLRRVDPLMFVWPGLFRVTSYVFQQGKFLQIDSGKSVGLGEPSYAISLSSKGDASTSGILWVARSLQGGRDPMNKAVVEAYDACSLDRLLWSSTQNAARDDIGTVGRFIIPLVDNGRLYMATAKNLVTVYGLFQSTDGSEKSQH